MSCADFPGSTCRTVTLIEPDDLALTATSSGSSDPSLDERGEVALAVGQSTVNVVFTTPKSGTYRFEYLYVDYSDIVYPPAVISAVPITQTPYGFTVKLAGAPALPAYTLRWRVTVTDLIGGAGSGVDTPERLRIKLPQAELVVVEFVHPRSSADYGFSELRVENLTDLAASQRIVLPQIFFKGTTNFSVGLNPSPDTDNYYLIARTP